MASPLARKVAVREPAQGRIDMRFDGFSTDFSTRRRQPGRHPTSPAGDHDHEWTSTEERFCAHHADVGAGLLADLLGVTGRELIDHMGSIGVDVAPVPLLGDVCPLCGRRMPVAGHARDNGVCDACNSRLSMEVRAVRDAELRAHNDVRRSRMADRRSP